MFTPIKILHQLPFLRLLIFLVAGIGLASIRLDVNLGVLCIFIALIIALICLYLSPHLSYIKGFVIFFTCISLGYFSASLPNPIRNYESMLEEKARNISEKTSEIISEKLDKTSSSLCLALCLANKSELNKKIKKDFSRAGASHILAVSGMHVGIIFTAISTLFGLISKSRIYLNISNIVALIFLWFYAFLCELQPSIIRACTMFTIPIIGKILNRDSSSLNSLLFTAFCMLIYDHTYLYNIGFQLSFLAVAGILLFQEKIFNIFQLQNKILIWIWNLTSVSIAAQITTLPLTIYYFHELPILSLFSNLFVIPLSTLLIYCTGIFLVLSWGDTIHLAGSPLGNAIIFSINKLSYYLKVSIEFISNISYAVIEDISFTLFHVITLYFIIISIKIYISTTKPLHLMWILSLIILFLAYDIIYLLFM